MKKLTSEQFFDFAEIISVVLMASLFIGIFLFLLSFGSEITFIAMLFVAFVTMVLGLLLMQISAIPILLVSLALTASGFALISLCRFCYNRLLSAGQPRY